MKTGLRPAFYALPTGSWRDYLTLLHPPFTVWHLSYVVIGSAAAPVLHLDRLAGLVLAFFLSVGLAAHALDEYRGRPLHTSISDGSLLGVAAVSLSGAILIGVVATLTISVWAVPFVLFGALMVPAYNLEILKGRFHSDVWFGLSWGAFPALCGYWANAERLDEQALVVAAACFVLSLAQRTLSAQARRLRRSTRAVSGRIEYHDGRADQLTTAYLLAVPERALRLMGISIALLAVGWLIARL